MAEGKHKSEIILSAKDRYSKAFNKAESSTKKLTSTAVKGAEQTSAAIDKNRSSIKSFSSFIVKGATLTTAAISGVNTAAFAMVKSTAEVNDRIGKISNRLGASTEALSEYRHVAKLTGVTFKDLTEAFQNQQERLSEAVQGTGEAKEALETLGLSARKLQQLKPEDQFEVLADAINSVGNESDKIRLAIQIWESEGARLINTIDGGSKSIKAMRSEAKALGLSLSKDQTQQAAVFNDTIARTGAVFSALKDGIANEFMPQFTESMQNLNKHLLAALPQIRAFATQFVTHFINLPEIVSETIELIKDLFRRIYTDKEFAQGFVQAFRNSFQEILSVAWENLKIIGTLIRKISSVVWVPFKHAFQEFMRELELSYTHFLLFMNQGVLKAAQIASMIPGIDFKADAAKENIKDLATEMSDLASQTNDYNNIGKEVIKEFEGIGSAFAQLGTNTLSFAKNVSDEFGKAAASPELEKFKNKISSIYSNSTPAVQSPNQSSAVDSSGSGLNTALTQENQLFLERLLLGDDYIAQMDQINQAKQRAIELARMQGITEQEAIDQMINAKVREKAIFLANEKAIGHATQARASITNTANRAMQEQMLSLVETGEFSARSLANTMVQAVKVELTGIAAKAAVQALYETAMGFAALARYDGAAASAHFTAAKQFGVISGVALSSAAAVDKTLGKQFRDDPDKLDFRTGSGDAFEDGGRSSDAGSSGGLVSSTGEVTGQNVTNITVNIEGVIDKQNLQQVWEDELLPIVNDSGDRNFTINSNVVSQGAV